MNFQELLNLIADGDVPGIQFTREKIDPYVVFTKFFELDAIDWLDFSHANRN